MGESKAEQMAAYLVVHLDEMKVGQLVVYSDETMVEQMAAYSAPMKGQ